LGAGIARDHHEKWDGSGYPRALKGEEIPIAGRIVALADVLDSLVHERCYRKAWDFEKAMTHIQAQAGSQFDPALVGLLYEHIAAVKDIYRRFP
jgi:response regulator RpfG family c-di-GMP phosphodiesterase